VLVQEKESVYLAVDPSGTQCILKFIDWEELFSNVRKKRLLYKAGTSAHSWLFLVDSLP
jgi:RIO-like serine/threonine protein kinase